jgi:hypothetical protein
MTESRKLSAAETWRALETITEESEAESKLDDETERVLALGEEELARELADEGFDAEAVRARGEAVVAAPEANVAPIPPAPEANVAPIPAAPAANVVSIAAAPKRSKAFRNAVLVLLAAAAAFVVVVWYQETFPDRVASPPPRHADPDQ